MQGGEPAEELPQSAADAAASPRSNELAPGADPAGICGASPREEGAIEVTEDPEPTEADPALTADSLAMFTGTREARSGGQQTAMFTDLRAGGTYLFAAVLDPAAEPLLGPENLLYILQLTAEGGTAAIPYVPRTEGVHTVLLFGPENGLFGDCNGDKTVNKADRAYLARALADVGGYTVPDADVADLNGDSRVDRTDRIALARQLKK